MLVHLLFNHVCLYLEKVDRQLLFNDAFDEKKVRPAAPCRSGLILQHNNVQTM